MKIYTTDVLFLIKNVLSLMKHNDTFLEILDSVNIRVQ